MTQFIIGNWKMHKTVAETKDHIQILKPLIINALAKVGLAVPYTDINTAAEMTKHTNILIGAQNMSDLLGGALTGEISATMLIEAGAKFVILGHSERRRIFNEDDFMIDRKVRLAIRSELEVVLCVGETLKEREEGKTAEVIEKQLKECLSGVDDPSRVNIAYEPVWAIGSKKPATEEIIAEIHTLCKNLLTKKLGWPLEQTRVLYGGSVNADNAKSILSIPVVDGLLVGGASLDVQSFANIVLAAEERT